MKCLETELMEKVITFDGTTAIRKNCRFIKGDYYLKNVQCFLIGDRWYRINSGYIVYDYEVKAWVLQSSRLLTNGIVEMSDLSNPIFGYFTPTSKNEKFLYKGSTVVVINAGVLSKVPDIKEGMNGAYYYPKDRGIPLDFIKKLSPHKDGFYNYPFNYSSDSLIPQFLKTFLAEFKAPNNILRSEKYLGVYTYGIEFETNRGSIPEKYLEPYGLIPCRDGSIQGFEYATVPLQGGLGIQAIKAQCELLRKFCSCSVDESLHIHVGNYPRNKKAIAALFRLGQLIEKDVYAMFPYYYANTSKFKKKAYCNPLPKSGMNTNTPLKIFNELFLYLSNGERCGSDLPKGPHPMDRSNEHKWEISPRYVWLNMIPLIWGGRETVEFRCHVPTLNSGKVINWLFIVIAILKYARKHTTELVSCTFEELEKVGLRDIIKEIYPRYLSAILSKYIEERCNHYSSKTDPVGEDEITLENNDKELFNLIPIE